MSDALSEMYRASADEAETEEMGNLSRISRKVNAFVDSAIEGRSNKKERELLLTEINVLSQKYKDLRPVLRFLDEQRIRTLGAFELYKRYKK